MKDLQCNLSNLKKVPTIEHLRLTSLVSSKDTHTLATFTFITLLFIHKYQVSNQSTADWYYCTLPLSNFGLNMQKVIVLMRRLCWLIWTEITRRVRSYNRRYFIRRNIILLVQMSYSIEPLGLHKNLVCEDVFLETHNHRSYVDMNDINSNVIFTEKINA